MRYVNIYGAVGFAVYLIVFAFPLLIEAQEERLIFSEETEWDRLGISQTEWMMIKKENIPKHKVELLLKAGIGIKEYCSKPWIELGISEEQWIRKRQAGLEDEDIASRAKATTDDWAPIHNFFLPGFHHFKRKQYVKAYVMSGVAITSAIVTVYGLVTVSQDGKFVFSPMIPFVILGADMVWSCVDILVQINREKNPDASRFSNSEWNDQFALSLNVVF